MELTVQLFMKHHGKGYLYRTMLLYRGAHIWQGGWHKDKASAVVQGNREAKQFYERQRANIKDFPRPWPN
jgi:hypothetical protein